MKKLRNNQIAVITSLLIPILAILSFILYEEIAVATGDKVSLIVRGYDPTDYLRGHYIRYQILDDMVEDIKIADPQNILIKDEYYYRTDGYISLKDTNNDGVYDSFGDFYIKKPNIPYINGRCVIYNYKDFDYNNEDKQNYNIYLDYNQDRYYLNENLAPIVEDEINKYGEFSIVGTTKSGYFRASHIEVNGAVY